jgi:hypothetical protein
MMETKRALKVVLYIVGTGSSTAVQPREARADGGPGPERPVCRERSYPGKDFFLILYMDRVANVYVRC